MTPALIVLSLALPLVLALAHLLEPLRLELYRLLPLAPLPGLLLAFSGSMPLLEFSWLLEGAVWGLDDQRRVFLGFTSLIWSLAGLDACFRFATHDRRHHFSLFWLLSLCGNLGLILAQDIGSFYAFFSLMTLASYGLVAHRRQRGARRAGRLYIAMAVGGEMVLLAGLIMAVAAEGITLLSDIPAAVTASELSNWIFALLFAGFGVKAGVPLLHFWLPPAYLAAPTPASAVLSGAMINAGLLGWLFTLPLGVTSFALWGELLVAIGLSGAFGGVLVGLCQRRAKAVLGYSSISQMGLMIVLIGVALADASVAPAAVAACTLYAMHHGLVKSALFLAEGVVPRRDTPRAGFLLLAALPGLSLAGVVASSGAAAKSVFKTVLSLAQTELALAPWLPALLSLAALGTMLLVLRFLLCLGRSRGRRQPSRALRLCWMLALACSLLVFWWLPRPVNLPVAGEDAVPLLGLATGLGHPLDFLWPPVLALALAALALRLGLRAPRVPPGDFVVILERRWRRWRRTGLRWAERLSRLRRQLRGRRRSMGRRWARAGRAGAIAARRRSHCSVLLAPCCWPSW